MIRPKHINADFPLRTGRKPIQPNHISAHVVVRTGGKASHPKHINADLLLRTGREAIRPKHINADVLLRPARFGPASSAGLAERGQPGQPLYVFSTVVPYMFSVPSRVLKINKDADQIKVSEEQTNAGY